MVQVAMLSSAALLALLLAASPDYATVRGMAEPVSNLGRFLEQYLGDCESNEPSFDRKGCEAEAAKRQKRYAEQVIMVEIEDPEDQLHFAEWDSRQNAYRLHLTPFFGERALAVSVGKPERLNAEGLPVVKNVPIWVKLPAGESEALFRRQLERGQVRLELLLKPRRPWRIKRKNGDADFRGLDVALLGLRVYPMRGQAVLAEQTY